MDRLLRFNRLQEDKATEGWRQATDETSQARAAREQASAVQGNIAAWKADAAGAPGLNIDHYQVALALEAEAADQLRRQEDEVTLSESRLEVARDRLQAAAAAVKAADRRDRRQQRVAADVAEKKVFEDLRDTWLGRPEKAHG